MSNFKLVTKWFCGLCRYVDICCPIYFYALPIIFVLTTHFHQKQIHLDICQTTFHQKQTHLDICGRPLLFYNTYIILSYITMSRIYDHSLIDLCHYKGSIITIMISYEQQQRDEHEEAAGQRVGRRAGVRVPRPPGAQLRALVVAVVEVVDTVSRGRGRGRARGRARGRGRCRGRCRSRGGQRGQQEADQHSPW